MKKLIALVTAILVLMTTIASAIVSASPARDVKRYTVLVLDHSGSMGGRPITAQAEAAKLFCESMMNADGENYIALVEIDSSSSLICDFTNDLNKLEQLIKTYYGGGTDTAKALTIADSLFDSVDNESNVIRNVVLCSDGLPDSQNASYNIASTIKDKGITIYSLGFFHSLSGSQLEAGRSFMNTIQNGGYYEVGDPNDLVFAFGEIAEDVINPIKEITFSYNSGHDGSHDYTAKCYYTNDYFGKSSDIFDNHLATMSLAFALSACGSETGGDENYTRKNKNATQLLLDIGCTADSIESNDWFTMKPTTDSIGVIAGNKSIKVNGEKVTLIALAVRGGGYEQEWASNFTIGTTGPHNGFNDAKDKVLEFLKAYVKNHSEINGKVKLWLTGYSRAAATANLLSGELHNNPVIGENVSLEASDIYTYCFETPKGALKKEVEGQSKYDNIWNIINPNDPVTYVAPENIGFARYGRDWCIPTQATDPNNYKLAKEKMLDVYNSLDSTFGYNVDTFKMKKLSFESPSPFKYTIEVQDNNNNNMSQATFLNSYIPIVSKSLIGSRPKYEINYQSFVRELSSLLTGCSDSQVDAFKESVIKQAKENWPKVAGLYYVAICFGIVSVISDTALPANVEEIAGFGSDEVIDWIEIGLKDAGINDYNKDLVNVVGKKLLNTLLALLISHPNYATTLITNADKLKEAHYPDLCFSWLASMDNYYSDEARDLFNSGGYRIVRINCEVDVIVKDSEGTIVASITNEKRDELDNSFEYGLDSDGQKFVVLPVDDSYDIQITARKNETVDYGIFEYNASVGDCVRNVNFDSVEVNEGETINGQIPSFTSDEIDNPSDDGSKVNYSLDDPLGKPVDLSDEIDGESIDNTRYKVLATPDNPDHGVVDGSGLRNYGEYAMVEANAYEGYQFVGWYENDILVSEDISYRFKVEKDIELVAKFKKTNSNLFLNGIVQGPDGKWAMYKNGVVDTSYTGIAKNLYGWWRVENGYVNFEANGIYKNEFGWWKTTNGKVTFLETGVFKNEYGWWRVENSRVNFLANGIYKNDYGWWKTTNGKVTFDENGVFQNIYGWWYVKDSKVDFDYTGIASNNYGKWYIKNGRVDFTKAGFVTFDGKTYTVLFGKVLFG